MNIVAAIFADFQHTFLGGPSQLATPLGSRTVLGHTLARLMRVARLDRRCLVVRDADRAAAAEALRLAGFADHVELLTVDDGRRPRRALFRCARKWGLPAWRGSLLGTTWFDEFVEPAVVARVLEHCDGDAVFCVDGHQAALDPTLCAQMIAYLRESADEAPFVFTQAPPGLAGLLLGRQTTRDLVAQDWHVGLLVSYRPELPRMDPITKPVCCRIDPAVAQTAARWIADTTTSRARLAAAFAELGEDCAARELCAWERSRRPTGAGLPVEVEIELTTEDPLPQTTLRPRGDRVPARRLEDGAALAPILRALGAHDDRLVVLAGHGDPLMHPALVEVCRLARDSGVCGLAIETPLVELPDDALEALTSCPVDVVEVRLDANSPETYRRVHGRDAFDLVLANLQRIEAARRAQHSPAPVVACSLTRCAATLDDLEAFYDRWIRTFGSAVIRGYNDYCGVLPADTLLACEPPTRGPCRRLGNRLMLLADGRAVLCHQDVGGEHCLGDWREQSLQAICAAAPNAGAGSPEHPLCRRCHEWHRP